MTLASLNPAESLAQLKPRIGSYDWMIAVLKARTRSKGYFPSRTYQMLQRFANPAKPFFIGTTRDGIKYLGDYRDEYSLSWMAFEAFDEDIIGFLKERLAAMKGNCLDIGANIGVTTALDATLLAGRGEVYAFEPMPQTALQAAATIALNGLTNAHLYPVALSDTDTEITFFYPEGRSEMASASVNAQMEGKAITEVKVPCIRLDSLMDRIGRVGLIKIDVEGHELSALRGASGLLVRDTPAILYEHNPPMMESAKWQPSDMKTLLTGIAPYKLRVLNHDNTWSAFPPSADNRELANIFCEAEG